MATQPAATAATKKPAKKAATKGTARKPRAKTPAKPSTKLAPGVISKSSPVTGEPLAEFPITNRDEVFAAVQRARDAFPAWRDTPLEVRLEILKRLKGVIEERSDTYARQISADTGKPYVDSVVTELLGVPMFIDYYARTAKKVLKRKRVQSHPLFFAGKSTYVEHFPMGVIGVIAPWNFPFQLSVIPVISALIAGNTVVLKPSEVTPITGELIRDMFDRIHLPEGVVQVIQGDGSTGAALVDADIDKVFFTGSVATGRKVMKAAANKPIPVELELGGKDPFIVCEDANLERAAKAAAWGGLVNCGQMCTSVERILVVDSVHDQFVALLQAEVEKMKVGGPDEHADMGPLTFGGQLKTIEAHVKQAIKKGATILTGGARIDRAGQFYAPTLLTDVTTDMDIYIEETFGPVLPVIRVRDEEEAVRLANDHQYGLTASVWTSDIDKGMAIASRLECGQVCVNEVVLSVGNWVLPFGGVKSSGFGRYHGPEGLLSFTHQKAILVDKGKRNVEPFWFPYGEKYPIVSDMFSGILQNKMVKSGAAFVKLIRLMGRD